MSSEVHKVILAAATKVLPKSKLGKAIQYTSRVIKKSSNFS